MPARTDEELFDLLLLGLTWAQRKARDPLAGLSGFGVLQTMFQLGLIDGSQFVGATHQPSESLCDYIGRHTHPISQPGRTAPRRELYSPYNSGDQWLIAPFKRGAFYEGGVTRPGGYRLVVAISGQRRALFSIAGQYIPKLTEDAFMQQWRTYRRRSPRA